MAEPAQSADHRHGHMPVKAQAETYGEVMALFKWCALGVADLIIVTTLWFCTPAGFAPALIVGIIVAGLGVVALRGGKADAH
jgi:hypothetical protein